MASTFGIAADLLGLAAANTVTSQEVGGPNEQSQNATCPNSSGSVTEETVYGLKSLYTQTYEVNTGGSIDIANVGDLINTSYLHLGGSARYSLTGETGVMVTFNVRSVPAAFASTREFDTGLTITGAPGIPDYLFTTVAGAATALSIDWGTSDFDGLDGSGDVVAVECAACRISVTVEMQLCSGTPSLTWAAGYTDESKDVIATTNTGYPVYTFQAFKNVTEE